jgi:hypothetical protein
MKYFHNMSRCFYSMIEFQKALHYFIGNNSIKQYQEKCRFYLDELEGQEELRKEWFNKKEAKKFGVSVDYLKWAKERIEQTSSQWPLYIPTISKLKITNKSAVEIIDEIVDDYCNFESDQIFQNRWMVKK